MSCYYSAPVGVRCIVINPPVCASVCLSVCKHLWNLWTDSHKFCLQIPYGRGSVILRRRCATLCTSCFMDDVTFGRNGRDAERWRLHRAASTMTKVAIPGRSVMSMNACLLLICCFVGLPIAVTLLRLLKPGKTP